MIDLYTWITPNGRKVSIMLEECGLEYEAFAVDILKGEQFQPHFLKVSPNAKIPAIVDRETGMSLMESGAILMYLARKTGRFMPCDEAVKWSVVEWVMWQMGGFGPMLGQTHHFLHFNPGKSDYAEERFGKETTRLYGVLDHQLSQHEYVAGDYSVADMAIWPWASRFEWQNIDMNEFPYVKRWYETVAAHPAVQRGYNVPREVGSVPMP
ncbi:glutathione S-transferase N-terminal domain-containing protein [Breoghania sp.]|uniref:glutathione S-transferase N-terminal domain-containing protein n=1 Tax=Breoghania sp. TaxID=2065378 RepID=UPI00260EF7B4|nr:glutathione S-transferase N-terminal domain-containing protein [Breoghania sp.]MDJ0933134.1 glutathione S-transferase N-terminal domain-containing protein [Breoghania sp.]